MTPEEITQKIVDIASDTLTEIPIYPRILEVIREAQREEEEFYQRIKERLCQDLIVCEKMPGNMITTTELVIRYRA